MRQPKRQSRSERQRLEKQFRYPKHAADRPGWVGFESGWAAQSGLAHSMGFQAYGPWPGRGAPGGPPELSVGLPGASGGLPEARGRRQTKAKHIDTSNN